ncbi:MAG: cytochrome P450 [Acidimicrobiales bacterium]
MSSSVDLTDLDAWQERVPYEEFARLRRDAPIVWFDEELPNHGFWSIHRYADIVEISRDTKRFSSADGISFEEPTEEDMAARRTIIDMDPPEHTKLRRVLAPSFTPRAVAVYEHFVRSLTTVVLDDAIPQGEFDFVRYVARDANTDPEITDVVWGRDDTDEYRLFPFRSPYGKQLWDIGRELVRERLLDPSDDLLSVVLSAEIDGERLSEVDLDNFFSILVIAGNETTRIAIAQGILYFCENPGEWDRLRSDPSLLNSATEEVLRYSCPTHFMRRTANEDITFKGVEMKKGDKVILWYVSGNRDEDVFTEPERFDVGRSPNPHLSFGRGGPHMCLGAHLARLEVRVVLEELSKRVKRFELAGEPARIRANFTNGLKRLPITVTPV